MSSFNPQVQATSCASSGRGGMEELAALQAQREALELEAEAIGSELLAPGPDGAPCAGIKDPLVDKEGFPRGDVDIYRVRTIRGRLACINTDHKALMKRLTRLTHSLHAAAGVTAVQAGEGTETKAEAQEAAQEVPVQAETETELTDEQRQQELLIQHAARPAFATIDQILPGSPAVQAALVDGDLLVAFGTAFVGMGMSPSSGAEAEAGVAERAAALAAVPQVVRLAHGVCGPISLVVRTASADAAEGHFVGMGMSPSSGAEAEGQRVLAVRTLLPAVWSGRGLLGLHLTPK